MCVEDAHGGVETVTFWQSTFTYTKNITVKHNLKHQSGYFEVYKEKKQQQCFTQKKALEASLRSTFSKLSFIYTKKITANHNFKPQTDYFEVYKGTKKTTIYALKKGIRGLL